MRPKPASISSAQRALRCLVLQGIDSERATIVEVFWVDSHCHIQERYLEGVEAGEKSNPATSRPERVKWASDFQAQARVIERARVAGVERLVCVGTDPHTSRRALEIAASFPEQVWAAVGLHPHEASMGVKGLDEVAAMAEQFAIVPSTSSTSVLVAIGECGLDYHYDNSPRTDQREAFAAQIALAKQNDLALIVHTRDAWEDTFDILKAEGVPERTVVHCFTGGPPEAKRCLDMGAYISFSGIVTFKNAQEVREAVKICPLERLLVETDSPFLAPVPHRGKPNEPSYVVFVGEAVAEVKGMEVPLVQSVSTKNATRLFGWRIS